KLDPPNWWSGHSINPVMVLIQGKNLAGARVEVGGKDVRTTFLKTSASGTYLFVDIWVDPAARPGPRTIKVTTPAGSTQTQFEITSPLGRQERFKGFTTDDVIYLIMPDRFSNGDPSNDDPPRSRGLLSRAKGRFYHGGDLQGIIDHL